MLFSILWICAWLEYSSRFIVQVAAASYYFDSNASRDGSASVGLGFKFAYLKHMGSLALGSFIIAVVRFIKYVFVYLSQSASKATGENVLVQVLVKCALCYLDLLEKITDYINESAYAYMAVSGESFCTAAWHAFLL